MRSHDCSTKCTALRHRLSLFGGEQSFREAYHLFTTLARDLANRYTSFKIVLGKVVKNNTALRVGTRDYDTLFESLILEPLKALHIVGPILVVIDALDESGDTTSRTGLHAFLAKNLIRLPSNFRVVITSRPEHAIVSTLVEAQSVKIKYMDDAEISDETHKDILAFFQQKLPSNEFRCYVEALALKAEGLFQWAAVASQLILDPPARFGFNNEKCVNHLLEPSTNRRGQDLLDRLYKDVLEGYFTDSIEARVLFRSVVGQLITSIEPLTIHAYSFLCVNTSLTSRTVVPPAQQYSVASARCLVVSILPTKTFPSFLSTHRSVTSSQIKTRAAIFISLSVMFTMNQSILVSIYYSILSMA